MNTRTIELPEGFIVDKEKSTDTKIVLKETQQCDEFPDSWGRNKI